MGGGGSSKKHMSLVFSRNKLEGHVANTNRDVHSGGGAGFTSRVFSCEEHLPASCRPRATLVCVLQSRKFRVLRLVQILRIDFNAVKIAAK